MFHTITFAADLRIPLARGTENRREQLLIPKGAPLRARVWPYVVEGEDGPVEVADLLLADGTALYALPCECFSFVD